MLRIPSRWSPVARSRALRERAVAYSAVLVAGFFGLVSYAQLEHVRPKHDALRYLEMSQHTFAPVESPFALRLLTPWLVRRISALTHLAPNAVWLGLTFAATTCALVVVYEWLRGTLRIGASTSLFATLLLAVTYNYTSFNYWDFWLVDPLNNLVFALGLLLAFRRRLVLFSLVVLVGFLNKETALLLLPLYPMLAWARSGRLRDRSAWSGVGAGAVVTVCYLAFRHWAQARIGATPTWAGDTVTDIARAALSSRPRTEHLAVFSIFGFLWAVFGYGLFRQYRGAGLRSPLLLASGYLLLCCLAGRTQATDTERVYVLVAPVVVAVAATVFDSWRSEGRRMWMWLLGGLYAALQFFWVTGETAVLVNLLGAAGFVVLLQLPDRLFRLPARDAGLERHDASAASAGTRHGGPAPAAPVRRRPPVDPAAPAPGEPVGNPVGARA